MFSKKTVIGKKWTAKNELNAESSVITYVAHMQPRSNIQTIKELAPSNGIYLQSQK